MSPDLQAPLFGLLSAALMGAADFSGGVATRRVSFAVVIAVSHACGLVLLVALALLTHSPLPTPADALWAAGAGLAVLGGLAALYRAMAVGRMGLVAPVSGLIAAALPVGATMFTRGLPASSQIAGFVLGMIGIGLIAQANEQGRGRRGLGLAVLAGLGFGAFFVLFGSVQTHAILWPLSIARLASCSAAMVLARGGLLSPGKNRGLLPLLLGTGVLDIGGNAFFVLATHAGRLDIAAVLASLYPASTILLARVVLRERLNGLQMAGIAAALVAIVLITLG